MAAPLESSAPRTIPPPASARCRPSFSVKLTWSVSLLARQERPSMIHWEWVALNVFRAASSLASNAKAGTAGENVFPKGPSFRSVVGAPGKTVHDPLGVGGVECFQGSLVACVERQSGDSGRECIPESAIVPYPDFIDVRIAGQVGRDDIRPERSLNHTEPGGGERRGDGARRISIDYQDVLLGAEDWHKGGGGNEYEKRWRFHI